MSLRNDIAINSMFCPICHHSTLKPHWMGEYNLEWHKCSHCAYMELKSHTKSRVVEVLTVETIEPLNIIDKPIYISNNHQTTKNESDDNASIDSA